MVKLGKRGGFDIEDVIALLLWIVIILLFLFILDMGGCTKRFSKVTIKSERENIIDSTRALFGYLNNEVEYENRNMTISDLISELYTTQDASKKDEIQKIITEKTKEILDKEKCWTIIVIAKPSIRIESDKCGLRGPLMDLLSRVRITTKIPGGMEGLEVEYQEYLFIEVGGAYP